MDQVCVTIDVYDPVELLIHLCTNVVGPANCEGNNNYQQIAGDTQFAKCLLCSESYLLSTRCSYGTLTLLHVEESSFPAICEFQVSGCTHADSNVAEDYDRYR